MKNDFGIIKNTDIKICIHMDTYITYTHASINMHVCNYKYQQIETFKLN